MKDSRSASPSDTSTPPVADALDRPGDAATPNTFDKEFQEKDIQNGTNGTPDTDKPAEAPKPAAPNITYPGPLLASVLYFALLLAMFLVALDMSIIATAIPTITSQFHSTNQVGWYGSAFFMTLAAFQAAWGRAYKFFPLKTVFLTCISIFELGSLIVAVAPNSPAVVAGRAIQGVGGAGITGGCYTICAFITPQKRLAAILGLFSVVWSCSSVLGPVLGGVFTSGPSWRWCFFVNLPIGGTTIAIIAVFFRTPPHSRVAHMDLKDIPFRFDIPGIILMMGSLICYLIALQDGGLTKPWSNSEPIGLLVGFVVLLIAFGVNEWWQGENAILPRRIIKRRTIWALCLFTFCAQGAGFSRIYNLPIYFQAVQGVSATQSGVRTLPTVLTTSIFAFLGSVLLGKVGFYQPFLVIGAIFSTVGSGTIYTLGLHSKAGEYIGYQVLTAIGSGLVIQLPVVVVQAISTRADMSVGVATVLFAQFFGGTIGVSAAQSIQDNVILNSLPKGNPNIDPALVLAAGSKTLSDVFKNPADLHIVITSYMKGLRAAWIWSIVLSGLAFFVAFLAEWKSINPEAVKKRTEAKKEAQTAA